MNDADRHWILERAARVLEPDVYSELEMALRPSSRTDEADSEAVPKRPSSRMDVAAPLSEADNREIWGK